MAFLVQLDFNRESPPLIGTLTQETIEIMRIEVLSQATQCLRIEPLLQ